MRESPSPPKRQSRPDRLIELILILRDGKPHRGTDLARRLRITPRTLYRDMDTLAKSGVPISRMRGKGYRMREEVTLPPLNLSMKELEALHLGLAVMTAAEDTQLHDAARALGAKIDAALPEQTFSENGRWALALHPFAAPAAGVRHMPLLREALRTGRILRIGFREGRGRAGDLRMRPKALDYWGRVWTCTGICVNTGEQITMRLDQIGFVELA